MLTPTTGVRYFVAREPVDFRKAHDGLCAVTRDLLCLDPMSGHVFVFFNKRHDRIKLLYWERNGFWLGYKRLERGTFQLPFEAGCRDSAIEIDARQLQLLLGGIDLRKVKCLRHHGSPLRIDMQRDGRRSTTAVS